MKSRSFSVSLDRHEENFSGLRSLQSVTVAVVPAFVPTAANTASIIRSLFPGAIIDEQDMTLSEQIHDSLACGYFTVKLKSADDFIHNSICFMEV